jgi:hypothetical protein
LEQDPVFITRDQIDAIHHDQIESYGGVHGIRNEDGLESAIAQPQNVYHYGGGDLSEIAAAYAFYIGESQAYLVAFDDLNLFALGQPGFNLFEGVAEIANCAPLHM